MRNFVPILVLCALTVGSLAQTGFGNMTGTWSYAWQNSMPATCYPNQVSFSGASTSNATAIYTFGNNTNCPANLTNVNVTSLVVPVLTTPYLWQDATYNYNFIFENNTQLLQSSFLNFSNQAFAYTNVSNNAAPYFATLVGNYAPDLNPFGPNTPCCYPAGVNITQISNSNSVTLAYFFGAGYLTNPLCGSAALNGSSTATLSLNFTSTSTMWQDSTFNYTFVVTNGSLQVGYSYAANGTGTCQFPVANWTQPSNSDTNGTFGSPNLIQEIDTQCCQPYEITFTPNTTNPFYVGVSYTISQSQLAYCNNSNLTGTGNILSTLYYSIDMFGHIVWQDLVYPFSFQNTPYAASGSYVFPNSTNSSNFTRCEFDILLPGYVPALTSSTWGNFWNVSATNGSVENVTAACCIPDTVLLSPTTTGRYFNVSYNWGLSYLNNPWCAINPLINVTTATSQVVAFGFDAPELNWVDPLYNYSFNVNATNNFSVQIYYIPSHGPLKYCSFNPHTFSGSNFNGSFSNQNSNSISTCCQPESVSISSSSFSFSNNVTYTFSTSGACSGTAYNSSSTLVYSTYGNGTNYWADSMNPFQYVLNGANVSGYNTNQSCSFQLGPGTKSAAKLALSFVTLFMALLLLN